MPEVLTEGVTIEDGLALVATLTLLHKLVVAKDGETNSATMLQIATLVNAQILGAAPAQLDTIAEIAAALNNDANLAATLTAAITLKADKSRTISGGGLATGGGDLSADRTITVTKSTSPQAVAGVDAASVLTPAKMRDALNAAGSAPVFACRAWANFNGTGTVAIRGSGNISSIADGGVGIYTVNMTTAMPDTNYAVVIGGSSPNGFVAEAAARTTTSFQIRTADTTNALADYANIDVAVFR